MTVNQSPDSYRDWFEPNPPAAGREGEQSKEESTNVGSSFME
jgi:hypothetical protein